MKLSYPRSHNLMFDMLRANVPMWRFNEFLLRWFDNESSLITFLNDLDQLGLEIGVKKHVTTGNSRRDDSPSATPQDHR
jgi:hypothetical protein